MLTYWVKFRRQNPVRYKAENMFELLDKIKHDQMRILEPFEWIIEAYD